MAAEDGKKQGGEVEAQQPNYPKAQAAIKEIARLRQLELSPDNSKEAQDLSREPYLRGRAFALQMIDLSESYPNIQDAPPSIRELLVQLGQDFYVQYVFGNAGWQDRATSKALSDTGIAQTVITNLQASLKEVTEIGVTPSPMTTQLARLARQFKGVNFPKTPDDAREFYLGSLSSDYIGACQHILGLIERDDLTRDAIYRLEEFCASREFQYLCKTPRAELLIDPVWLQRIKQADSWSLIFIVQRHILEREDLTEGEKLAKNYLDKLVDEKIREIKESSEQSRGGDLSGRVPTTFETRDLGRGVVAMTAVEPEGSLQQPKTFIVKTGPGQTAAPATSAAIPSTAAAVTPTVAVIPPTEVPPAEIPQTEEIATPTPADATNPTESREDQPPEDHYALLASLKAVLDNGSLSDANVLRRLNFLTSANPEIAESDETYATANELRDSILDNLSNLRTAMGVGLSKITNEQQLALGQWLNEWVNANTKLIDQAKERTAELVKTLNSDNKVSAISPELLKRFRLRDIEESLRGALNDNLTPSERDSILAGVGAELNKWQLDDRKKEYEDIIDEPWKRFLESKAEKPTLDGLTLDEHLFIELKLAFRRLIPQKALDILNRWEHLGILGLFKKYSINSLKEELHFNVVLDEIGPNTPPERILEIQQEAVEGRYSPYGLKSRLKTLLDKIKEVRSGKLQ